MIRVAIVAYIATALAVSTRASATPLGIALLLAPRIEGTQSNVNYNATSHVFQVSGVAGSLETPPAEPPPDYSITSGFLVISLTLNTAGSLQSGSIQVTGTIPAIGATPSPLLTGIATAWGYVNPPGGNVIEFLFTVSGGKLSQMGCGTAFADACFPLGSTIGAIVTTFGNSFPGTFNNNYQNTNASNTTSIAPPVPEPAGIALILLVATGLIGRRTRRGR